MLFEQRLDSCVRLKMRLGKIFHSFFVGVVRRHFFR